MSTAGDELAMPGEELKPGSIYNSNRFTLTGLTEALGPKGVSTDAHEIEPHLQDWRGRWHGSTPVLVKPSSTEEVAKAMTLCAEYGFAVNPQGGNSGMVNGSVPDGEVLISLKRMNRVREVDVLNDAMTLEAGVILTRAQQIAEEHDRLFPLSLGAQGVAMEVTSIGLDQGRANGVAMVATRRVAGLAQRLDGGACLAGGDRRGGLVCDGARLPAQRRFPEIPLGQGQCGGAGRG